MTESVAAVLVPCASRKSRAPQAQALAVNLRAAAQSSLLTDWLSRLSELQPECLAEELYRGRGFALGREAAAAARAPLFVISAGLGLVEGRTQVPSYGITIADRSQDSIVRRAIGKFDPASWWEGITKGPYSVGLQQVLNSRRGVALVALSRPYANMLAQELGELPQDALGRLRIVGLRLTEVLPAHLAPQVMPYDERLDAALPGTRADFAQRALLHFATTCGGAFDQSALDHRLAVESTLAEQLAPARPQRPKLSDDQLLELIKRHLPHTQGVARLLKIIRRTEGVACEQARFSRLYRHALNREAP